MGLKWRNQIAGLFWKGKTATTGMCKKVGKMNKKSRVLQIALSDLERQALVRKRSRRLISAPRCPNDGRDRGGLSPAICKPIASSVPSTPHAPLSTHTMAIKLQTGLGERLISSDVEAKAFAELPIIDMTRLTSSKLEDRQALALEAAIESGFFYISNHGIPQSILDEAFAQGKQFFAQPTEKKMEVDLHKGTSFKGYAPLMGEAVDPASRGDVHESFDMGSDSQTFHQGTEKKEGVISGNLWPSEKDLPGFKPALEATWDQIMALGKKLFPLFALALNLSVQAARFSANLCSGAMIADSATIHREENYFDDKLTNPGSVMRILHYPPQTGPIDMTAIGIGSHSDYEMFTLLVQHGDVSALQVLNSAGDWVQAPPIPGTIVVNIADQLQRWTNGVFKSTIHRAINRTGKDRMSLPFFFGVDYDVLIEVLPSCITEDRPAKYEPVKAGEWVEQRLKETYIKVDPVTGIKA
ncbi:BZ3500_MvSof-1268-A1-R1_Chr7-1g09210 [Microbotryum saponariae]|uniref:BZ3500_MvSof-1268-A1-R1_Chr7-1g09210 protein n=1 Tax=Microbotryum saponariae TaxID=289078 RepID=A0A2X0L196_9BASI|nr:BZ3501_MvSof-1269-A2-R1_Chr7-1g08915 [Microbotryum saponariae]SDA03004.1 BZ3500_MvSof-1268-A1-R1_Chr7-1g09210 [Microbotryum saponariae]